MISVDAKGSSSECPTARLSKRTEWPQKGGRKIKERERRVPGLGFNMLAQRSPTEVQQRRTDRPCHEANSKEKQELSSYGSQLTRVILGEGLDEIGGLTYHDCSSLIEITIPPAVKVIGTGVFSGCTSLTRVVFNIEIEEFVSAESMREWWNHGIHDYCLSTYCFLIKYNIPKGVWVLCDQGIGKPAFMKC
jgi:hypothetical protein